jgi:LacI family transcriptional regulator
MKRLTIKDVAKHASVSIATVSRVINNSGKTSVETREKVLYAIEALGYRPNALARGLVSHKSNSIGVLVPDVSNYFFAEVFRGMEDAVHERNGNVFICSTDVNESRMLRYLDFLQEKQVEGIIFTSEPVSEITNDHFKKAGVPVVLLATEAREFQLPAIKINEFNACHDAVTYLIEKGHRHIGMIHGPESDPNAGFPRLEGYKKAMKQHGLQTDQTWLEEGDYRFDSGRRAMHRLLKRHPEISAVFTASDEMACGAMVEAQRMGKVLPRDLSVMGFDNVKLSAMYYPSLTTVAQPLYEMGKQAVNLLYQLIQTEGKARTALKQTTYLPHQIIERESVTPPGQEGTAKRKRSNDLNLDVRL